MQVTSQHNIWAILPNLVPRVSHLTALSSLAPGGGKMRDPGNEVAFYHAQQVRWGRARNFRGVFLYVILVF